MTLPLIFLLFVNVTRGLKLSRRGPKCAVNGQQQSRLTGVSHGCHNLPLSKDAPSGRHASLFGPSLVALWSRQPVRAPCLHSPDTRVVDRQCSAPSFFGWRCDHGKHQRSTSITPPNLAPPNPPNHCRTCNEIWDRQALALSATAEDVWDYGR